MNGYKRRENLICVVSVLYDRKMHRWRGKVAIVTGASAGIGAAIARALPSHDIKVVGLARNIEKLEKLADELGRDKFFPIKCDVTKEEDILKACKWVENELGGADILINNAGIIRFNALIGNYRFIIDLKSILKYDIITFFHFFFKYIFIFQRS